MEAFKDIYNIVKTALTKLKDLAKKVKNQEMLDLAMDIQDKIFEIKDQMQDLKEENSMLLNDLKSAQIEIQRLNNQLEDYENIKAKLNNFEKENEDLAFYNEKISLNFTEIHYVYTTSTVFNKKILTFSLDEIFKAVSLKMMTPIGPWDFVMAFSSLCEGYQVNEKQALQVKAQFLALGLIEVTTNKKGDEVIKLTAKGLKEMQKLNTIKQGENK